MPLPVSIVAALLPLSLPAPPEAGPREPPLPPATTFEWPCDDYRRGLRGAGNFGVKVGERSGAPFAGTWHLAEDVWLPGGTEVRAAANGRVRYADFSPTWTDDAGRKHWNLGHVVVIEHALSPPDGDRTHVCSVYVHLAAGLRVSAGDVVRRGAPIGAVGADRSEENGEYPAHLHFGLHVGPYFQLAPSWRRELARDALEVGLPASDRGPTMRLVRSPVAEVTLRDRTTAEVRLEDGTVSVMSTLVGSTSPGHRPADIVHWCRGYGDRETVDEWLRPSEWIERRRRAFDDRVRATTPAPPPAPSAPGAGRGSGSRRS